MASQFIGLSNDEKHEILNILHADITKSLNNANTLLDELKESLQHLHELQAQINLFYKNNPICNYCSCECNTDNCYICEK